MFIFCNYSQVLYDGDCPLCVKEIKLLKKVNKKQQTLAFIDLKQPGYKPEDNQNISLDEALGVMRVIGKDGQVTKNIQLSELRNDKIIIDNLNK